MASTIEIREKSNVERLREKALTLEKQCLLEQPIERLWPFLSNTDMQNYWIGLNASNYQFTPTGQGGSNMSVTSSSLGLPLVYEEFPYEWQENKSIIVERIFNKGPLEYLSFESRFEPTSDGKTQATLAIHYVPKLPNFVIKKIIKGNLQKIGQYYQTIDKTLDTELACDFEVFFQPSQNYRAQIDELSKQWQDLLPDSTLPQKMAEFIYLAPDRYVSHLKPFEFAQWYSLEPLDCLNFCLMAAQEGFLHLNWDLRCPSCRGAKDNSAHLHQVSEQGHCETCSINYDMGFDDNLELTFVPDKRLRTLQSEEFCAGGPANTPHLAVQINVWPGESKELTLTLSPGNYRFVSLSMNGDLPFILSTDSGLTELVLELGDGFDDIQDLNVQSNLKLTVKNPGSYFQSLRIENLDFNSHVLSAALVSSLQEFRDSFSQEAVAEHVKMNVNSQVIGFSQIINPLALYRAYGDEKALAILQQCHELILQEVQLNHGAMVKNMSDATMMVFGDVLDGIRAFVGIQEHFYNWNEAGLTDFPLQVQLSLNQGACIIQGVEGQNEYFGTTVNIAQEIGAESHGQDFILTSSILNDPMVVTLLTQVTQSQGEVLRLERQLRALDEPQTLYRVKLTRE